MLWLNSRETLVTEMELLGWSLEEINVRQIGWDQIIESLVCLAKRQSVDYGYFLIFPKRALFISLDS